jgi:hypothetical protein
MPSVGRLILGLEIQALAADIYLPAASLGLMQKVEHMAGRRRIPREPIPVQCPRQVMPGAWWASRTSQYGIRNLKVIWAGIEALVEEEDPPTQVAVRLEDRGERSCWDGAGDTPEWDRHPWGATVWIGPLAGAKDAVRRLLRNQRTGQALCRGIEIEVSARGRLDFDEQRDEALLIANVIVAPRPPEGAPECDFVRDEAIRAAACQGNGRKSDPSRRARKLKAAKSPKPDLAEGGQADQGHNEKTHPLASSQAPLSPEPHWIASGVIRGPSKSPAGRPLKCDPQKDAELLHRWNAWKPNSGRRTLQRFAKEIKSNAREVEHALDRARKQKTTAAVSHTQGSPE